MTEQVVQIPVVTTGFIKCAPMLLRYKTGYRQQERGSLRTVYCDLIDGEKRGAPKVSVL
jgi:hypothetical protein